MFTLSYIYSKIFRRLHGTSIKSCKVDKTAVIYTGCNISYCTIGKYSYIGYDNIIECAEIGNFCSFSDHIFIGGAEHPLGWVSTSPVFENIKHSGPRKRFAKFDVPHRKPTIIGSDVWVGHGVTMKEGLTIGHGAVIGSGSVVTKDVPPYAVVAGVPAKVIKYRFSDDIIKRLLDSEWWNLPDQKLEKIACNIKDPIKFLESIENA